MRGAEDEILAHGDEDNDRYMGMKASATSIAYSNGSLYTSLGGSQISVSVTADAALTNGGCGLGMELRAGGTAV